MRTLHRKVAFPLLLYLFPQYTPCSKTKSIGLGGAFCSILDKVSFISSISCLSSDFVFSNSLGDTAIFFQIHAIHLKVTNFRTSKINPTIKLLTTFP